MKRKVVYNSCYGGGYRLSSLAIKMLYEKKYPNIKTCLYIETKTSDGVDIFKKVDDIPKNYSGTSYCLRKDFGDQVKTPTDDDFDSNIIYSDDLHYKRHDPDLVAIVEELGSEKASGSFSNINIIDIGNNYYKILEEDGLENVIIIQNKEEDGECKRI